jgi:hypothetical protein
MGPVLVGAVVSVATPEVAAAPWEAACAATRGLQLW